MLARLRLEPGELLEEITIYTSALDLEYQDMVEATETEHYKKHPGPLCSALRLGTSISAPSRLAKLPPLMRLHLTRNFSHFGMEMSGMTIRSKDAAGMATSVISGASLY